MALGKHLNGTYISKYGANIQRALREAYEMIYSKQVLSTEDSLIMNYVNGVKVPLRSRHSDCVAIFEMETHIGTNFSEILHVSLIYRMYVARHRRQFILNPHDVPGIRQYDILTRYNLYVL